MKAPLKVIVTLMVTLWPLLLGVCGAEHSLRLWSSSTQDKDENQNKDIVNIHIMKSSEKKESITSNYFNIVKTSRNLMKKGGYHGKKKTFIICSNCIMQGNKTSIEDIIDNIKPYMDDVNTTQMILDLNDAVGFQYNQGNQMMGRNGNSTDSNTTEEDTIDGPLLSLYKNSYEKLIQPTALTSSNNAKDIHEQQVTSIITFMLSVADASLVAVGLVSGIVKRIDPDSDALGVLDTLESVIGTMASIVDVVIDFLPGLQVNGKKLRIRRVLLQEKQQQTRKQRRQQQQMLSSVSSPKVNEKTVKAGENDEEDVTWLLQRSYSDIACELGALQCKINEMRSKIN